jgi:hypothetical protein
MQLCRHIIICGLTQVNYHNWIMNFKVNTRQYNNPIKLNYPGRTNKISFHTGFSLYLLRTRRDTGLPKLAEIFDKVEKIGQELAPDGKYKLSITGHSLGGAHIFDFLQLGQRHAYHLVHLVIRDGFGGAVLR